MKHHAQLHAIRQGPQGIRDGVLLVDTLVSQETDFKPSAGAKLLLLALVLYATRLSAQPHFGMCLLMLHELDDALELLEHADGIDDVCVRGQLKRIAHTAQTANPEKRTEWIGELVDLLHGAGPITDWEDST